jgi:microcystin-dependent protein
MPKIVGLDISGYQVGSTIDIGLDIGSLPLPFGFLACDGSAISRTTYATLFAIIGTNYGVGDGSTTFNLPDSRGRTHVGVGTYTDPTAGPTTVPIGQSWGEAVHVLSVGEMPSHNHALPFVNGVGSGGSVAGDSRNVQNLTGSSGYNGGNGGHNNIQPSLGFQKAIAYI